MFVLYALLLLMTGQPRLPETVAGLCRDATDGLPVAGAIVRSVDEEGRNLRYIATDSDGAFSINTDSNLHALEISMLGYKSERIVPPFSGGLEILLERSTEHLQEVIIRANKVRTSGDTVQFNIKALKSREDLVLGDALKRLPGIDVSESGRIRVDGKEIDQFLSDGKDVLDKNYDLAVKKLSVNAVASVEIIRGHQRVKMLRGLVEGEDSAINIHLEETAKGKVNLGGSLGGGYEYTGERVPLSGELNAFSVLDKWSTVDVAEYDSEGRLLKDATSLAEAVQVKRYDLRSCLGTSPISAPMGKRGIPYNQTADFRTINTFATQHASSFGAEITYAKDREDSFVQQESEYYTSQSDGFSLKMAESRKETQNRLQGQFKYTLNGTKAYIRETLVADCGNNNGETDITGDIVRYAQSQTGKWNVGNALDINWSAGTGRVFGVESYFQWSGQQELFTIPRDGPLQTINTSSIWLDVSFRGLSRKGNSLTWSLMPKINWHRYYRENVLTGLMEKRMSAATTGTTDGSVLSVGLGWSIIWRPVPSFKIEAGGVVHYDNACLNKDHQDKIFPDSFVQLEFETGRWQIDIRAGLSQSAPDNFEMGNIMILTDYNTFWRGNSSLLFLPQGSVRARLFFREPVSGWDMRLILNGYFSRDRIQGREFLNGYIVQYASEETVPVRNLSGSMEISKGIYAINGKLTASISHNSISSVFFQSEATAFLSRTMTLSLNVSSTPVQFWSTTLDARYTRYGMNMNKTLSSLSESAAASLKNTFYLTDAWTLSVLVEAYYNRIVDCTYVFPDLMTEWKIGKHFRVKLLANNLLNIKDYSYISISPMLDKYYNCRIRPFSLLVGLNWTY